MQLTRQILIEKQSLFFKYSHPKDVPVHIWEKVYLKFNDELKDKGVDILLEYLAQEIFSPLLDSNNYIISISNKMSADNGSRYMISFEKLYEFEFNIRVIEIMLFDSPLDEVGRCHLERYVSAIWDTK